MKSRPKFKVGDVLSWEDPRRLSAVIEQWDDHNARDVLLSPGRSRSLNPFLCKIYAIEQYGNVIIYRFDQWYYAERVWAPPIRDCAFFQNRSRMETGLKRVNKLELLIKHNIT